MTYFAFYFNTMDFKQIITGIYDEVKASAPDGKVSDYIPELAKVEPDKFGIALITTKGSTFSIGDVEEKFSIQSIAKVFLLSLAFSIRGDSLWERVNVEPSGNPFNSVVQLEYEKGNRVIR